MAATSLQRGTHRHDRDSKSRHSEPDDGAYPLVRLMGVPGSIPSRDRASRPAAPARAPTAGSTPAPAKVATSPAFRVRSEVSVA